MNSLEGSWKWTNKDTNLKTLETYPMFFECVGDDLYFIDRMIYDQPLTNYKWFVIINTATGRGKNRKEYNFGESKILLTKHNGILDCEIILHQDAPVLPDASCVRLYEHGMVIKQITGFKEYKVYDRVEIMRRHTLQNIIENG